MFQNTRGGYVGILVLVLSVGILVFLYAKVYFTPEPNNNATEKELVDVANSMIGTTTVQTSQPDDNRIKQLHRDVDTAKAVQGVLDGRAEDANNILEGI